MRFCLSRQPATCSVYVLCTFVGMAVACVRDYWQHGRALMLCTGCALINTCYVRDVHLFYTCYIRDVH